MGKRIPVPYEVPPPGCVMLFPEWSAAIVAGVRKLVLDVKATRRGERFVLLRLGEQFVTLTDDGSTFVITFGAGAGTMMASLHDWGRRDAFSYSNFVKSVAGYFDARLEVRQP
jgi:hypothetical protein